MSERKKHMYAVLIVAAVLFSVVAFLAPIAKNVTFAICYLCELIAIILQVPLFKLAFEDRDSIKSKVLGFPVFRIGYIYLAVQTVVSLVLMILSTVMASFPAWIAAVLCAILICGAVICSMGADIARDTVEQIESEAEVDTSFMMAMRMRSAQLVNKVSDGNIRAELQRFADNVRFSDPVSSNGTEGANREFELSLNALENAVRSGSEDIIDLCRAAQTALEDRNTAAKISKRG